MQYKHFNYFLIVIWSFILSATYWFYQPAVDFTINPLIDSNWYLRVYDNFVNPGTHDYIKYPFHSRVFIPWLASLISTDNPKETFFIVSSVLGTLSLVSCWYIFQVLRLKPAVATVLIIYISLHWFGPFRHTAMLPINVDMGVILFETLYLAWYLRRKYYLILLTIPIAIFMKEVALAFAIVLLFVSVLQKLRSRNSDGSIVWMIVIVCVGILTKLILEYYFPTPVPGRSVFRVMAFHIREALIHPAYMLRWMISLFAALGAFLFLADFKKRRIQKVLDDKYMPLYAMACAVLILSVVGGRDYTRLIFLGSPIIITAIILFFNPHFLHISIAFILSLIISRFWMVIEIPYKSSLILSWMPDRDEFAYLHSWFMLIVVVFTVMISMKYWLGRKKSGVGEG